MNNVRSTTLPLSPSKGAQKSKMFKINAGSTSLLVVRPSVLEITQCQPNFDTRTWHSAPSSGSWRQLRSRRCRSLVLVTMGAYVTYSLTVRVEMSIITVTGCYISTQTNDLRKTTKWSRNNSGWHKHAQTPMCISEFICVESLITKSSDTVQKEIGESIWQVEEAEC